MELKYKRDKDSLIKIMNTKADKGDLVCKFTGDRVEISAKAAGSSQTSPFGPIFFKGKIKEEEDGCGIVGKFTYGPYLISAFFLCLALIIARFIWSLVKAQWDNILVCALGAGMLIVGIIAVLKMGKDLKEKIKKFLNDLDVR